MHDRMIKGIYINIPNFALSFRDLIVVLSCSCKYICMQEKLFNSNECAGTAVLSSHIGLPKTVKSEVNSQCHV